MKKILILGFALLYTIHLLAENGKSSKINFFQADNPYFLYTGRIDFTNMKAPRMWAAGAYVQAKFIGDQCEIMISDEEIWSKDHNYIAIQIDNNPLIKYLNTAKINTINVSAGLDNGIHTITICKNTEASIGYIDFMGLKCKKLLPLDPKPKRKIEFIGNSITSGTGMDISQVPCDSGKWYDQHSAYMSYGPLTARALEAQWHLTSISGIGLVHSCCNMKEVMPDLFDKVSLREGKIDWSFQKYIPDVVTICLGQNDGKQDSINFCKAYVKFIKHIRSKYPNAQITCLSSPMANEELKLQMRNYLTSIVLFMQEEGDQKVDHYFFSKGFNNGCGGHPDLNDHKSISNELIAYIKSKMKW